MTRRAALPVLAVLVLAGTWWYTHRAPAALVLTGIVTTHDVVVSPQIGGRLDRLLVREGDTVAQDQLLAVLAPDELRADQAFYAFAAEGAGSQVQESEAALRFEERQTRDQIAQAEATLAATISQRAAAVAQVDNARIGLDRADTMNRGGIGTQERLDDARTAYDVARATVSATDRQIEAQRAAVALARTSAEQVAARRSALLGTRQQQKAAAAQQVKAEVRLAYTELHAPIPGIVDVRAARQGEVVTPGQAVVTLINPDDLWVRADVEESYIDRVVPGATLTIRLPSGDERTGTVFYRGVDASFATQRDVSRTKRDIRTFEVRLRVPNADRHLAVGMTAYVLLPVS